MRRMFVSIFISLSVFAAEILAQESELITIEGIASEAGNGGVIPVLLDALLYVVIFLAILSIAFFMLVRFKLYSKDKYTASNQTQKDETIKADYTAQNATTQTTDNEQSQNDNLARSIEQKQETISSKPKQENKLEKTQKKFKKAIKINAKKSDKTKSLFDI